jgi:hypothetical protein
MIGVGPGAGVGSGASPRARCRRSAPAYAARALAWRTRAWTSARWASRGPFRFRPFAAPRALNPAARRSAKVASRLCIGLVSGRRVCITLSRVCITLSRLSGVSGRFLVSLFYAPRSRRLRPRGGKVPGLVSADKELLALCFQCFPVTAQCATWLRSRGSRVHSRGRKWAKPAVYTGARHILRDKCGPCFVKYFVISGYMPCAWD